MSWAKHDLHGRSPEGAPTARNPGSHPSTGQPMLRIPQPLHPGYACFDIHMQGQDETVFSDV
jgi:hypothetical protein